MSHRAEEKERRRLERLAAEEAAKKSADRRKRFGLVGGVVLVVAVLAIVAVATGAFSGDDGDPDPSVGGGDIPAQQVDNLNEAVRASSCELTKSKVEGRGHTGETVKYATNPPTSGDHDPTPAEDGIYEADGPPDVEQSVHSLEHGRILVQYKKGTPAEQVAQLEAFVNEEVKGESGYHTLLFQNQTNMEPAVAVTAWGQSLTCASFDDKMWDAMRAFRRDRVDKGPEFIP